MKVLAGILIGIFLVIFAAFLIAATGSFNVAAKESPGKLERRMASFMVDRSVARRAPKEKNPFSPTPDVLRAGLAHYKENCVMCHGAPGVEESEAGMGLNPSPPDLTSPGTQRMSDGELYWIVANGIRMSGMPAFSLTHKKEEIWHLVTFVRHLPQISADEQKVLKAGSEEEEHHQETEPAQATRLEKPKEGAVVAPTPHTHAPGTKPHSH
jgi:mono/diheme cytochrome c family protein